MKRGGPRSILVAACLALAACQGDEGGGEPAAPPELGPAVERRVENGPVRAVIAVAPAEPRLGDRLRLILTVTAKPGVELRMPDFGEALGRFSIASFEPRSRTTEAGDQVAEQVYTLHPPMSGAQRIPPLRVEYVDRRQAGTAAGEGEVRELLTEELPIQIASVLPEGEVSSELRPVRGRLESLERSFLARTWWIFLTVGALIGVGILIYLSRKRSARQVQIDAFGVAMKRLDALVARGLPTAESADEWFVELSAIVRRYLEDRFALRAPELTTEEFLRVARASGVLTAEHQESLGAFLEICDRVKFAQHAPDDAESNGALDTARGFLTETRLTEAEKREVAA